MSRFNDRYGIPGNEIENLYSRWIKKIKRDCQWETFDDFLYWAASPERKPGLELRKIDATKPHGPNNSFWYSGVTTRENARQEQKKKMDEYYSIESPFCKSCGVQKSHCINGCLAWKEWWIKNWNANICVKPKAAEKAEREVFQYEHPELVREGIAWTGADVIWILTGRRAK